MINFSTTQRLCLDLSPTEVTFRALGGISVGSSSYTVQIILLDSNLKAIKIQAYVIKNLGVSTPFTNLNKEIRKHIEGIDLADPHFYTRGPVDLILGSGMFAEILVAGILRNSLGNLTAQNTRFGWIVMGKVNISDPMICLSSLIQEDVDSTTLQDLHELIQKFWKLEEVCIEDRISIEDQECEKSFKNDYQRDEFGRYIVRLPIKSGHLKLLGNTFQTALKTLESTERRLKNDKRLAEEYYKFMSEYERLGHMKPVNS